MMLLNTKNNLMNALICSGVLFCAASPLIAQGTAVQRAEEVVLRTFSSESSLALPSDNGFLGNGEILEMAEDKNGVVVVKMAMDRLFLDKQLNEDVMGQIVDASGQVLQSMENPPRFRVLVRYNDERDSEFLPLENYLPVQSVKGVKKPYDAKTEKGIFPHRGSAQPSGSLAGKSVFLTPGHGWKYVSPSWVTQRGLVLGMIEDHGNLDFVTNYVAPYLWNAGAGVYTTRERDRNSNQVIVDNAGAGYSETGTWTLNSGSGYAGSLKYCATTTGAATATATFTPTIPADGYYSVYVDYRPQGTTTTAGSITINHAGGSTQWVQNMNRDGYTWKYIGSYYFEAGASAATGSVVIDNSSSASGSIIADAVRFGGGTGTSGYPQAEESGVYYAPLMSCTTAGTSHVNAMPNYANWEAESWEDPIYVSLHSNATGGTPPTGANGTLGLADGDCWECWDDTSFDGIPGSMELMGYICDTMVDDIQEEWDSGWNHQGYITRNYGELNSATDGGSGMVATIIEVGYHDATDDVYAMTSPEFRRIAARSVYKGIEKYYAWKDSRSPNFLPETPTHFWAEENESGEVVLSWAAPEDNGGDQSKAPGDPATGYKVYRSTHPKGFPAGSAVSGTSHTISSGLVAGTTYYFRVSATNAGGESFPSETLTVRYNGSQRNPILIVGAFDRLDKSMSPQPGGCIRTFLDKMNTFDYTTVMGQALADNGYYFDSTSNEAVECGAVQLERYPTVMWLCGEEQGDTEAMSATEQARLDAYLAGGGQLFLSGSEVDYALDYLNQGLAFYNGSLKSDFNQDNADTYNVTANAGGIFNGLSAFTFDDGTNVYDVDWPDSILPLSGATACLTYSGGNGGTAGIQYSGSYKVVNWGFPFETITSETTRSDVAEDVMNFFTLGTAGSSTSLLEARDASGNLTSDVIYKETGGWANSSAKSAASGLMGSGSRFVAYSAAKTVGNVEVIPNIPQDGFYEVFVTWGSSSNAEHVGYTVNHTGGSTTTYLDQDESSNDNVWHSLGTYDFDAGQSAANGSLVIDASTSTGPVTGFNGGRVYADGFKFVPDFSYPVELDYFMID
jgi:N-acetylmuramoyl-L-alanine amidase/Fe-S cluster assembly iron-binding protein IscA